MVIIIYNNLFTFPVTNNPLGIVSKGDFDIKQKVQPIKTNITNKARKG